MRKRLIRMGAWLVLAGAIILIRFGCNHKSDRMMNNGDSARKSSKAVLPSTDEIAIQQMEIAFEGGYKKSEIKASLDTAMELYSVTRTEENYSRAASSLIALREQNGTSEMDVLSYMIRSHVPGMKLSFAEAAGLSSAFLAAGDK